MTLLFLWVKHFKLRYLQFSVLLLVSPFNYAESVSVNSLVNLKELTSTHWQYIEKNPLFGEQYFLISTKGVIQTFDIKNSSSTPLLNVKEYYPELLKLTAVRTHPNFKLNQQDGFMMFYTAHIEAQNINIKSTRITEHNFNQPTKYDVVLAEWQLSNKLNQPLTLATKKPREVLRIAVPSKNINISQLAFNPYLKPWQTDYQLLFIALSPDEMYANNALYSGAVLRINPLKQGLKRYGIPSNNPFLQNENVNDELLITGLGKIKNIAWLKKEDTSILVNREVNQQALLSKVTLGSDLRDNKALATTIFSTDDDKLSNVLIYRGQHFKAYRNHLIYLTKQVQWQLMAQSDRPPYQVTTLAVFNKEYFADDAKLSILSDNNDELLIINNNSQQIYHLANAQAVQSNDSETTAQPSSSANFNVYLIIASFCFLLLLIAVSRSFAKRIRLLFNRKLLHSHYAKFNFDVTTKVISLFKRHQKQVSCTIPFTQIKQSQFYLNDQLICTISAAKDDGFSPQKEQQILTEIGHEKRIKMIDKRIRKLELRLTDHSNKVYVICPYFRTGNQRLTKATFDEVVQTLIDWCWCFALTINPSNCEERLIIPQAENTPSPANNSPSESMRSEDTKESDFDVKTEQTKVIQANTTECLSPTTQHTQTTSAELINQQVADIQSNEIPLVTALEKLAHLKQQGLLTDKEFEQAKDKILHSANR